MAGAPFIWLMFIGLSVPLPMHGSIGPLISATIAIGGPFLVAQVFRFALPPAWRERWTLWVVLATWAALFAGWAIASSTMSDLARWILVAVVVLAPGAGACIATRPPLRPDGAPAGADGIAEVP